MKTSTSKSILLMCCAIVTSAMSFGAGSPESNFLARYDIELRDGDLKSTFKSQAFLDESEKTAFGYTPHFVEIRLRPVSDSEYDVQLTVAPTKEASARVRLDKTFRGRYGIPLELAADADRLRIKGTLAIVRSK